jgi:hypothetical protein
MFKRTLLNLGCVLIAVLCIGLFGARRVGSPGSTSAPQSAKCVFEASGAPPDASRDEFVAALRGIPID